MTGFYCVGERAYNLQRVEGTGRQLLCRRSDGSILRTLPLRPRHMLPLAGTYDQGVGEK